MKLLTLPLLLISVIVLLIPENAISNERRFGYTYESSVLLPGVREIELWNTVRRGRSYFYRRFDQRIEYEFGVSHNLMSAFYLNSSSRAKDSNEDIAGGIKSTSYSVSISSEWKYKLLDRVADPVGCAIYGEGTLGNDQYEIEGKLILDKQIQHVLTALDIAGEYEASSDILNGSEIVSKEFSIKCDFGIAYVFSNGFGAGIEMRNENIFVSGTVKHSSLFAGTTISYSTDVLWAALSFLPQIHSFKGGTTFSKNLNFDEFEKYQTRLLLSFHI